ncbi:uncharacterized protein LOC129920149 isoform X3 [Episyrphus balteatus]|uniref:uncharacterized protein LOC129920149 isoform X3 n=1 Tax=Episyrphus balteatus TaxID=286459 RepID=UPI00248684D9|nr:uncharacterized protein LOC129920149 isoform X3 [Episyrphus balteatus]
MDTAIIVDLSDDIEMENMRKKLDRKRFNELKKYIPFLQYITAHDPVKNEKYVKLLQWFNSTKNFPARIATTCESAIKKRFQTLHKSMVFPPHIISIFEGGGEAIDLVSDDDCPETSENAKDKSSNNNNNNNKANNSSRNIEITKSNASQQKQQNSKNTSETSNFQSIDDIEEGEVLQDSEKVVEDVRVKKTRNVSLSEISLKEPSYESKDPATKDDNDETINQDLFSRIDNLDEDSLKPIALTESPNHFDIGKESTQRKRSPILRPKNLSTDNLSNISDDNLPSNEILVQRKKKKKHKHKKKCQTSLVDGSETENHDLEREKTHEEDQNDSPRHQKKSSKKKREKLKKTRSLYVSDDEDDQPNPVKNYVAPVKSVKISESELFQRRDSSKKETSTSEKSVMDSNTVVLLDSESDEAESNTLVPEEKIKTNFQTESSSISEPQPFRVETVHKPSTLIIGEKTSSTYLLEKSKEVIQSSPNKMKDLNNMDLNELNDIYAKLCERTGIQLEELLGDLVTKSSVTKNEHNTDIITIQDTNNYNNEAFEVCYDSYNLEEEHLQQNQFQQVNHQQIQHHEQLHQQDNHYQQQLEQQQFRTHQQHQHQQQQQAFPNHMHGSSNHIQNNLSVNYTYQNSLMPKLNLNDPRIVQKLKQIKDSPIHNLSIRESATWLMNNCNSQRPTYKSLPPVVVKPTSSTATTYGEHKRLKELEKQESELARQNKERERNRSPIEVLENVLKARSVSPKVDSTQKQQSKDSSGSEYGESDKGKTKSNAKRKNSSESESVTTGRRTADSRTNEDKSEDEETVVMSFGRPKSRARIVSSSSSSSNDTIEFPHCKPSTDNTESNIAKVVKIVMSALNQSKDNLVLTPSKSRRNSARKSTDSTKSDAKSQKSNSNSVEDGLNKVEDASSNNKNSNNNGKSKYKRPRRKTNDQLNKTPTKPAQPKRGNRELENLNCTFKEYSDMFEKFLLPTNDGKRLCSAAGNPTKMPEFSSSDGLNTKTRKTAKNGDSTDSELDPSTKVVKAARIGFRRKTYGAEETQPRGTNKSSGSIKVCFRRLSEREGFSVENIHDIESSDETDEFDIEEHRKIKSGLQMTYKNINKDPFNPVLKVTLSRLSTNEIKKWIKCDEVKSNNLISSIPTLIAQTTKPPNENDISKRREIGEMPILVPFTSKPVVTPKKTTPKGPLHLNNDKSMTLNSTKTCAICNKRPNDLTNHYIVQHQTESYTSRLTSQDIDNLEANITLAVRHRNRYRVTCAFCQVELEDNFVNFHAHFSFHTGEYGFKCAVCDLVKPYREDIRSHQYRTSTCLNGKIRSNYLYSPDLVVIYLYVCNLCNFVQLNEANIHKHQRDHHGFRLEDPQNVKKVIIAALDNGEILNEIMPADRDEDDFPTPPLEKDNQQLEQEFLDENPLDIKDVLVDQELPNTSQIASIENLLQDINVDNDALAYEMAPSPEDGLKLLHSPSDTSANVMTVVHTSNDNTCQESHKPIMEPLDQKPELKEIKIESVANERLEMPKMIYRQMFGDSSNYFGMYKCTNSGCWFSSNEAERFIQHVATSHDSIKRKISLDCAYCQFKTTKAQNIVGHVRAKHANCRYQCAECSYRSTIPGNVAIHRRMCHKNSTLDKGIYECASRVSQLSDRLADLKQKMVANIPPLKCPDCSESFYAISSLKSHIQKTHPSSFRKLDPIAFTELACLHCKNESNDKENMRIHLALEHPDEIGYVAERKLKNIGCVDAVENLNMINISLAVAPSDIYTALIDECDIIATATDDVGPTLIEDAPPTKVIKPNPAEILTEDVALILPKSTSPVVANISVTSMEEEKRLRPLLELLTENTGPPPSSLYRCPECIASFLHYELWQKHIITRHKITNTVTCPYCSKQFSLELAIIHFESHRRHEYICYHCVTSFCSREKIFQHFASFHPEFRSTIERKVTFGDVSFSIFKEKIVSIGPVDWLPLFQKLSDALRQQLKTKLQQNQHKEWLAGISAPCLAELEVPQYIMNGLPRYKCLCKSCPYVGSDENALNIHMNAHVAPDKYTCSHCAITQSNPCWENIKDHKMLHKQELYICCVCSFFYHSSAGMLKHIEKFHNFRDVPVISMWRDEINYKNSLSIVFPEKKMTFSTTDTCFCCSKIMKRKIVPHLKKEHKITLCPKCVICDAIILTHLDAEIHVKEHKQNSFRLKYEILTPFLYRAIVTSIAPFNFETRLIKEKRPSQTQDIAASISKKIKPNEDIPIEIKKEIVVKTEFEEENDETPSTSIKCVNLQNLMQNQNNLTQTGIISVQPISAITIGNLQQTPYQRESVGRSYIPNYTVITNNAGLIVPQNSFGNNVLIPSITATFPNPQEIMPVLRNESTCLSVNEQLPICCEINLPELAPICGNCNLECTDFTNLKTHFASTHSNVRFLFRLARQVECMYCSFRGRVHYLSAHQRSFHSDKMPLCRSLIDPNRCGICNEIFTRAPAVNQLQTFVCACPTRQRLLADCLDSNTLALLQSYGQHFAQYTCDVCNTPYNREQLCREHIVKAHKRALYPRLTNVGMMFVCFSCEKTDTSIDRIIEHIDTIHFRVRGDIPPNWRSVYKKINIIYRKGLTICAEDLKNTQYCHDIESFKKAVKDSEKVLI